MTRQCIEIVTYKTVDPAEADRQREAARQRVASFSGFGGWLPLTGGKDPADRVDVVLWASPEAAEAAAQAVGTSEDFAGFRAAIAELGTMGHYVAPANGLVLMQPGTGVEIGRFRLRQGVTEETMRAAYDKMIADHLSRQPGWLGQRLIRLQDGSFIDAAFATTQARAQDICNAWAGNAHCDAFLSLVEPVSMEFGAVA
ncbi:hypothetical protein V6L76_16990 [Pannonibacter sp. Pt2]|uniref:ABM domain-containing protein n=1 Tax=Pannonibacter anstelovis TaxID=3121537 RepID=A0ABU7ZRV2_9HYPH